MKDLTVISCPRAGGGRRNQYKPRADHHVPAIGRRTSQQSLMAYLSLSVQLDLVLSSRFN